MIKSAKEFVFIRSSQEINLYQRAAHEPATEEIWLEVIEKYPDMRTWVEEAQNRLNEIPR